MFIRTRKKRAAVLRALGVFMKSILSEKSWLKRSIHTLEEVLEY